MRAAWGSCRVGMDTEEMDRERAEAHLRLLAEEELRRATARSSDETAGSPPVDETVAELYLVHYPALLRVAVSLVRDVRMAEEVVQESFAALLGGGSRLGTRTGHWLIYIRRW